MIFLDTSAIYALADSRDPNHRVAIGQLQEILNHGEELLTHNYVLLESVSLLQARLGLPTAAKFAKESAAFVIEWVDKDLHASGIRELEKSGKRRCSLVDHISFLVMKRRKVTTAFVFDSDFKAEGFQLFEL
jgi:predicted nucleic acid-binding protein